MPRGVARGIADELRGWGCRFPRESGRPADPGRMPAACSELQLPAALPVGSREVQSRKRKISTMSYLSSSSPRKNGLAT